MQEGLRSPDTAYPNYNNLLRGKGWTLPCAVRGRKVEMTSVFAVFLLLQQVNSPVQLYRESH